MILIVEDDPVVRHLLERIAHRLRRPTRTAATLAEARAALESEPVDVAVCDLSLPDGDGLEFVAAIRATPQGAELPLAVCSSRADLDTVRRAVDLGASDYIRKPLDIHDVMVRLERLLARAPQRWLAWPELREKFRGDLRAWRSALQEARRALDAVLALSPDDAAFVPAVGVLADAFALAGGVRGSALIERWEIDRDGRALHAALVVERLALQARSAS